MAKRFKIILDQKKKENLDINNQIKASIKNTSNSIMAKIMVFLYEYHTCSMTELADILSGYFNQPIDRSNIYKYTRNLVNWGLVNFYDAGFVMMQQKDNELIACIKKKHTAFLSTVPSQFQKKFTSVKYYFVTKRGEEFIEWCANVLDLKAVEDKDGE